MITASIVNKNKFKIYLIEFNLKTQLIPGPPYRIGLVGTRAPSQYRAPGIIPSPQPCRPVHSKRTNRETRPHLSSAATRSEQITSREFFTFFRGRDIGIVPDQLAELPPPADRNNKPVTRWRRIARGLAARHKKRDETGTPHREVHFVKSRVDRR